MERLLLLLLPALIRAFLRWLKAYVYPLVDSLSPKAGYSNEVSF